MILFASLACNLTGNLQGGSGQPTPVLSEPTAIPAETQADVPTEAAQAPTQPAAPTESVVQQPTGEPVEPVQTEVQGPLCTVLTELNLRSGPGTAYRPPVRALPVGTELTPVGFNPQGVPGGPWVHVRDEARNETGWVSAGEQFVSCNIDLTQLPAVAVAPPPPPPAPEVTDSPPEGSFPEQWSWELDFSKDYFLRMRVFDTTQGEQVDGNGIAEVKFSVFDSENNLIYQHTEQTAGYCIFGGGEPDCNPWTIEDLTYKWGPGGPAVQSGDYLVNVEVAGADGSTFGNWRVNFTLEFL